MKKIKYIRSNISILIVFTLSSLINNLRTQLKKSLSTSTTKQSKGTPKQEAQFLDALSECIIQNVQASWLFINCLADIDAKQAKSYLHEQYKPALLSVSLITGARRYLVKQELLI